MEACPRPNEPQRTRWKPPIENAQRGELDLSNLIAVLGVEVRRRMLSRVLWPVLRKVRCARGEEYLTANTICAIVKTVINETQGRHYD
jgi:hypothetical protein